MTSEQLQQRYALQTHSEAFESTELKFWPLKRLNELLDHSSSPLTLTPSCHIATTCVSRFVL